VAKGLKGNIAPEAARVYSSVTEGFISFIIKVLCCSLKSSSESYKRESKLSFCG